MGNKQKSFDKDKLLKGGSELVKQKIKETSIFEDEENKEITKMNQKNEDDNEDEIDNENETIEDNEKGKIDNENEDSEEGLEADLPRAKNWKGKAHGFESESKIAVNPYKSHKLKVEADKSHIKANKEIQRLRKKGKRTNLQMERINEEIEVREIFGLDKKSHSRSKGFRYKLAKLGKKLLIIGLIIIIVVVIIIIYRLMF
jgi:hypothetical protein